MRQHVRRPVTAAIAPSFIFLGEASLEAGGLADIERDPAFLRVLGEDVVAGSVGPFVFEVEDAVPVRSSVKIFPDHLGAHLRLHRLAASLWRQVQHGRKAM
jgi:hypothetical protein